MSKKYIDAEIAETIMEHLLECDDRTFYDRGDERLDKVWKAVRNSQVQIINMPAANVAEVKHGKWINGKCSVCKADEPYTEDGFWTETLYCPNCGAKMEGEQNG